MDKLPEVDLDIDNDVDYIRDNKNKEDVTDDVLERVKKGSRETTFSVGGYDVINLVRITAENEGNTWMLKLYTQGNIVEQSEKNTDVYYSYYIVGTPYREIKITQETMANVKVHYIYNFTFHNNVLTVTDEEGEDVPTEGMEYSVQEDMLQINVSLQELRILVDELKELDEDEYDFFSVFAMGIYKSSKTVGGETEKKFARDSIGSGTSDGSLAGEVENNFFPDPPPEENGNKNGGDNGKDNSLTILLASMGGALLLVIIIIVILVIVKKKKKKGEGYREYTIAKPGGPSAGFSVGGGAPPAGPPGGAPPGPAPWQQQQQQPPQQQEYGGGYPPQGPPGGGQPALCPSCGGIMQRNNMGQTQCTRCGSIMPQY